MAKAILMKYAQTGVLRTGFYGFSWTTLFFGGIPAIFRGNLVIGLIVIVASMITLGLASIIWAFIYNKKYTLGLLEQGYVFAETEAKNEMARAALGVEFATSLGQ